MSMRMLIAKLLGMLRPDWRIIVGKHREDALAQADRKELDFMLLDINMPGVDGFELGQTLGANSPNAWVTLPSANVQQKVKDRAKESGFNFVEKLVTEEKLTDLLAKFEASHE